MADIKINDKLCYNITGTINENLNKLIETSFINSKILFLVQKSKLTVISKLINEQKTFAKNDYVIMTIYDDVSVKQNQIEKIVQKIDRDYSMIVCVGESEIINFSKLLSKNISIPLGVIPTLLDDISIASNFFYIIENCQFKKIETNYPLFLLFDFSIIEIDSELIINNEISALNFCLIDNELISHYFGLEIVQEELNNLKSILYQNSKIIKRVANHKNLKNFEISQFFAKNCVKIAFFSDFYCQIQIFLKFFNSSLSKDKSKLSEYLLIFLLSISNFYLCFFSKLSHIKITSLNLQRRVKYLSEQNISSNQIVSILKKYSFEYDYKKFYFISKNLNRPFKNEIHKTIQILTNNINFYKNFAIEKCYELSNEITAKKLLTDISFLSDFLENNNFLCLLRNYGFLEF